MDAATIDDDEMVKFDIDVAVFVDDDDDCGATTTNSRGRLRDGDCVIVAAVDNDVDDDGINDIVDVTLADDGIFGKEDSNSIFFLIQNQIHTRITK